MTVADIFFGLGIGLLFSPHNVVGITILVLVAVMLISRKKDKNNEKKRT